MPAQVLCQAKKTKFFPLTLLAEQTCANNEGMTNTETIPEFPVHYRLRLALESAGVTPEQMAAELGCHVNTVHNYLGGRTHPRRPALAVWALRTGVPVEWLLTGHSQPTSASSWNVTYPIVVSRMATPTAACRAGPTPKRAA